MIPIIHKTM